MWSKEPITVGCYVELRPFQKSKKHPNACVRGFIVRVDDDDSAYGNWMRIAVEDHGLGARLSFSSRNPETTGWEPKAKDLRAIRQTWELVTVSPPAEEAKERP